MSPQAEGRPKEDAGVPLVRIRDLRKSFGAHAVLEGIDLDVRQGEVVVVIGPFLAWLVFVVVPSWL